MKRRALVGTVPLALIAPLAAFSTLAPRRAQAQAFPAKPVRLVVPFAPAGIAVHIGARVMAQAGAGEVLVSNTVRDLTSGAGLSFEPRGEHALKGVPGQWLLFRALDVAG
jgi:class 3 adenylate cyclase